MFSDLFSSLDSYSLLWMPSSLFLIFFLTSKSYNLSSNSSFFNYIASLWKNKYNPLLLNLNTFIYALMLFIMFNNLVGLTPLTYGITSSLWTNSALASIMWGSILLAGWFFSPRKAAAHLCPAGAPALLIPFLILIETVSLLIRPLTLTVRLVANMSAGHIVMALLASTLSSLSSFSSTFMLMMLMSGYMLFEFFVSLIQSYIFTLLLSLYAEEHPN
uniref:ATP synthase F0 subunit 6 n=1 Tax=Rabdotus mooreanus TaxID=3014811 RepID=UPI00286B858F|nr:ATP synthase F0 subunit 6 [Rabdotus mooreanus]WLN31339.1 ATP synthase F0 subunit 6 [Rabdotus mooreanus]